MLCACHNRLSRHGCLCRGCRHPSWRRFRRCPSCPRCPPARSRSGLSRRLLMHPTAFPPAIQPCSTALQWASTLPSTGSRGRSRAGLLLQECSTHLACPSTGPSNAAPSALPTCLPYDSTAQRMFCRIILPAIAVRRLGSCFRHAGCAWHTSALGLEVPHLVAPSICCPQGIAQRTKCFDHTHWSREWP